MKHMLLAAVISLSLHVMFLGVDLRWFVHPNRKTIENRSIAVNLTSREVVRARSHSTQPMHKNKPDQKSQSKLITSPGQKRVPKISGKVSKEALSPDKNNRNNKSLEIANPVESSSINQTQPAIQSTQPKQAIKKTKSTSDTVTEQNILVSKVASSMSLRGMAKAQEQFEQPEISKAVPIYENNPAPLYPSIAKRRGITGTVILNALVNQKGKVDELSVHTSSGFPILDKNAMQAVKHWAFKPGKKGDKVVSMRVLIPVSYELK